VLEDRDGHGNYLPPPATVVVMGPPGVGKSTLIKTLVKLYTNHTIKTVTGPITLVTGKKKSANARITLIECPNDVCAMLDLAKVADLVLLMIDAKFGFEMETFEYLNMLQTGTYVQYARAHVGVVVSFSRLTSAQFLPCIKQTQWDFQK